MHDLEVYKVFNENFINLVSDNLARMGTKVDIRPLVKEVLLHNKRSAEFVDECCVFIIEDKSLGILKLDEVRL